MTRMFVLDKNHQVLDEIAPDIKSVSWRLNEIGRTQFFMGYADPKCTSDNLQYGNLVLIMFDNGLPDWVGVIDTPRKQTKDGIQSTAYSAEHLFTHRYTDKYIEIISSGSGGVFRLLVTRANSRRATGIDIGSIYYGGTQRKYIYNFNSLWITIKKLADHSGQDFDVTSLYDSGNLQLFANWYDVKGEDKTQTVALIDGENIERIQLDEQGKIANQIYMVGVGQTWGDERLVATANDGESQANYGYREYVDIQNNVSVLGTLQKNAEQRLLDKKLPVRRFRLTTIDVEPGMFGSYALGDRVRLQAFAENVDWTYDGIVRVIAMDYKNTTMRVEVEEYV